VTVHLMDDGLDTGPILAQQRVAVPAAMDAVTLEEQLFATGARLAAGLVPQVLAGTAIATPQDERAATYQPGPAFSDWIISPLLPAAWAWRFVRGVAPLHGPLVVLAQGEYVPVRRAIAWGENGDPPADLPAGAIPVQFRPGWVAFE
jgi:methionyl-tRNA formyltransferase